MSNVDEDYWEGGLKVLAAALNASHQKDWMDAANCQDEHHADTRFIRMPLPGEALIWEQICKQCPVSLQCMEWADETQATGVFAAGEWRE